MSENSAKKTLGVVGAAWALTLLVGGGALWAQSAQIGALTERVDALSLDASSDGFTAGDDSSDDLVSMRRRLRALEGEVGRLRPGGDGSFAVEVQPGAATGTPGATTVAVSVRPDAVVDALESEDPEVQERVRAALRREVDALRDERRDERRTRREERANEQVDAFAEKAGLSSMQTEELKTLLESEREQVRDIFRTARQDGDFANIRTKIASIREQTDSEAVPGLDEEQAAAYEKMREEEIERFTGGRGGGRNRGGGEGGGRGRTPR